MQVVKVFVARSQKSGFQGLEKSIMAKMENGKIYCTHRQSTVHSFRTIEKNSNVESINNFIKGEIPHTWFECEAVTSKKGEVFYKQI